MPKTCVAILWIFLCFFLMGCQPPSHLIRINESLPKNSPIEKETIVVYAQRDCYGDCPLKDKDVIKHGEVLRENVRQVLFRRYGRMTCNPDDFWRANYYVLWYKGGEPYRGIKAFCDEEKKDFVVELFLDKTTNVSLLKSQDEWVIDVK